MNYLKIVSKSSFVILSAVACATLVATDASAQRRGGGGGGGRSSGGGTAVGRAAPRGTVGGGIGGPRGVAPRIIGGAPYYPYYYRPGYYRPGISLGFYLGSPYYYGYPYAYYGYGAPYYGYYGYPGYAYGGYGYASGAYGYPPAGYGYGSRGAYGGVRIQGAPREAEVYADGYYVGIVDDFDGAFKHLELEPGAHNIEIRAPGLPPTAFEVNIQPGRTVTFHVR